MDNALGFPILSLMIFLPVVGALVLAFLPRASEEGQKRVALGTALLTFFVAVGAWASFESERDDYYQFIEHHTWIPQLGISYHVGVDGLSLLLVVLTTFLTAIAILSAWTAVERRVKEFMIFLLLLETGMIGVFLALDLILFYIFWEAMLIPMYFLIGVWGGPRRIYATIKFVLYTMAGSLLMLVAIIGLYFHSGAAGERTFNLIEIQTRLAANPLDPQVQMWMFLAFALAFAIKVPMFPFHTWLPDAHVEAPTAGSVILAGVLLKMGGYGFLRFCLPLFPDSARICAPTIMALAVIGIIYGALVALVQRDVKKLVAYSSVSHLGFVVLGIFAFSAPAMQGALLQMINHGLSTGALFLIVGMIYERRHTREIAEFGGLWKILPIFAVYFLITTLSSIGLPGLNGFVGEFLILLGSFVRAPVVTAFATTGVILGAIYMLWMFQRVMQGPLERPENRGLRDLNGREQCVLFPLVVAMFVIGLFPTPFLNTFDRTAVKIVEQVGAPIARPDSWSLPGPDAAPARTDLPTHSPDLLTLGHAASAALPPSFVSSLASRGVAALRPNAQGPTSKAQGPRPKAQGPTPVAQSPAGERH
jgi:NADH-quinone oxidoreductase subunit M